MKTDLFKYIFKGLIIAAIIGTAAFLYVKLTGGKDETANDVPKIIHDTTVITRYEKEVQKDTVIKWYEKLVWKEAKPKEILVQKVDSIFIEKIKNYDVMLKVDKRGSKLKIFALNQNGSILKESEYTVGNDFTATSANDKVFVKTKPMDWTGVELSALAKWNTGGFDVMKPELMLGLETGVSYMDKGSVKLGAYYDTETKGLKAGIRIGLNILK